MHKEVDNCTMQLTNSVHGFCDHDVITFIIIKSLVYVASTIVSDLHK
jgi:hypothetical protein